MGSEMCIRDSVRGPRPDQRQNGGTHENDSSVLVSLDLLAHILCSALDGLHCLADASPRSRVAAVVLSSIPECIIQRVNHSLYHSLYRHRPRPLKDVLNHSLSDFGDWVLKTPIPACNRIRRLREGNGPINAERYKALVLIPIRMFG